MAALSSGTQGVGVYLVRPLSRAVLAASLMKAGVSKSGSPAPKPTTSTPAFLRALALARRERVRDSATRDMRGGGGIMGGAAPRGLGGERVAGGGVGVK